MRSVCATRRTSWRTDSSAPLPVGTPALRKYFDTATSVASCDQSAGPSASSILKTTSPSAPAIFAGRRVHSTASSTSAAVIASFVTRRVTDKPFVLREGLGSSDRGAVTGAPAGRADKAAGSFLPGFAIDVFPSSSTVAIAMWNGGQSAANGSRLSIAAHYVLW